MIPGCTMVHEKDWPRNPGPAQTACATAGLSDPGSRAHKDKISKYVLYPEFACQFVWVVLVYFLKKKMFTVGER